MSYARVIARSNHTNDGRFGVPNIHMVRWEMELLQSLADEDLDKLEALSEERDFDLYTQVSGGGIGSAFGFGRSGFYTNALAHYGEVLIPEAELGDYALHIAMRNDKIKFANKLIELEHPLNECSNAHGQYLAELAMDKLDAFDQLKEKRDRVGFVDLAEPEQAIMREYEDDFEELRVRMQACVERYKVVKVRRTKERMQEIFRICHPNKLAEVDNIMEMYKGREDELLDDLERKYNPNYVPKYQGDRKVSSYVQDGGDDDDDEYM